MSGRDRDYNRDRPSERPSDSRREEPRRDDRRRDDYDDRRRDYDDRRRDYDYDDRRRDYDDRRRDYDDRDRRDDRRDYDRRPADEDRYRSGGRDEPRRPDDRSSGRPAPAKSSGGWGDEEPAPARSSGGWGDEPAPKSKSSGGGWGDDAPAKSSGGGWGDDGGSKAPAKSSGGGWGDDAPASKPKSSGGWGDDAPAKSSGGGGWGDDAPAKSSGGGWGDDGGSKAPAKSSGGGWGDDAPAKSSGGGGWGDDTPKSKAKPADDGWGGSSGGGDDAWGSSAPAKSGGAKSGGDDAWGGSSGGGDDAWGSSAPAQSGGDSWGGKSGGGGSGCRNCGEEGHFARECPTKSSGGGGGSGCRNCGEEGHFARECPNPRKPREGGDDDFVRPPRVDNPDDQCWRCGAMGHTAQNCSSRIECGNVPGRSMASKHNQLYTNDVEDDAELDEAGLVAASGEREDELFGTHINTGIQFSKYSEIKVEVYGENTPPPLKKFSDLGLGGVINNNLKLAKWDVPTPIQSYALPIGFAGRDIMGCAQTGSGKTAAFLFPIINTLLQTPVSKRRNPDGPPSPGALIVVPVRELAQQIHIEAIKFTYRSNLRSVVIYGGSGSRDQRDALRKGCDILIGTPGRLLDFLKNGEYSLENLKFLCFDEADRMLDLGFGEDMQVLLAKCPPTESRQTLMFSATFPEDVQEMAKSYLKPDHVLITVGRVGAATPTVKQKVVYVEEPNKFDRLVDLFHDHPTKTLIFVGRKITAEELKGRLGSLGVPLETIHGDKDQYRREEALADFKAGKTKVLIATDVAARGLDIPAVGHVINYDMPQNIDDYVHRIGRTGRVGHEGLATTFYNSGAYYLAAELLKILEEQGQEVEEWLVNDAQANPAGPRKVFQPKPKVVLGGNSGGGDSWGGSSAGGGGDSWGESGNNNSGGGDAWGDSGNNNSGGASADPWGSSGNNNSGGGGGWGEESAPAKSSGGGGWGEESAPAKSSGGGGWGEESAPAKKSSGGGGWGDDSAPAKSSGGGWGDDAPAKKSSGGGGWGDDSAPAKSSGGGWGDDAPSSSGGGGWGDEAPAKSSGGGGWGDDAGGSGW